MADIEWKCVACGFSIADGDGWLQVRMSEVIDYEEALAVWRETYPGDGHSLAELEEHPEAVPWQALHGVCDATAGEPYAIGVHELRTPWALVKWSAHLLEKTWLATTDWDDVLRRKHQEAGVV